MSNEGNGSEGGGGNEGNAAATNRNKISSTGALNHGNDHLITNNYHKEIKTTHTITHHHQQLQWGGRFSDPWCHDEMWSLNGTKNYLSDILPGWGGAT